MNDHESFLDDLQRDIDQAHRDIDRAGAPPEDLWNRVRVQAQPVVEKEPETMNTLTVTTPAFSSPAISAPYGHSTMWRYINVASTVAMVAAIAFGGWFTMMQLNSPNGSVGMLGLFSQTDESATCDVEPLSVDRVMDIVKNPIPFMENGSGAEPIVPERPGNPMYADLYEPEFNTAVRGPREEPTEEKFDSAAAAVDAYLPCKVWGTVGQAYLFWSPLVIQQQVLAQFPVFADEDTVRSWVQDELDKPALSQDAFWTSVIPHYDVASVGINPDRALSSQQSTNSYYFEEIITVGISIQDSDGDTVLLTTATGNQLISRNGTNGDMLVVTVGKPRGAETWFVVSHYPHS